MTKKIAVIMTVFNRYEKTTSCIRSLLDGDTANCIQKIVIVDSGSDGTAERIARIDPRVKPLTASSETYWAMGMRMAWEHVQELSYDYILWLNDDVVLFDDWLNLLVSGAQDPDERSVYVGGCVDPELGHPTYGAFKSISAANPISFEPIYSNGNQVVCDTLNGNVVLTSRTLDEKIGGFPDGFVHNLADLAYGLRATGQGYRVLLSAEPVGNCPRDHYTDVWTDQTLGRWSRLKKTIDAKHFPLSPWFNFCREFGSNLYILHFIKPYVKAAIGPHRSIVKEQVSND